MKETGNESSPTPTKDAPIDITYKDGENITIHNMLVDFTEAYREELNASLPTESATMNGQRGELSFLSEHDCVFGSSFIGDEEVRFHETGPRDTLGSPWLGSCNSKDNVCDTLQDINNVPVDQHISLHDDSALVELPITGTTEQELETSICFLGGLNEKLRQMGYGPLDTSDTTSAVSLIQSLIRDAQLAQDSARLYEASVHSLNLDVRRLTDERDLLSVESQCLQQDIANLENRRATVFAQTKKYKTDTERWIRELQVTIAKKEGQEKGQHAALNRKENDYERLKHRLQNLHSKRDKPIKRSIDIRPAIEQRSFSDDDADSANGEELLKSVVERSMARKINILCSENESLRGSLGKLQGIIDAAKINNSNSSSSQDIEHITEAVDSMDMLKLHPSLCILPADEIENEIEALRIKIQDMIAQQNQDCIQSEDYSPDHVKFVENQLAQARSIIEEQDRLLQMSLYHRPFPRNSEIGDMERRLRDERNEKVYKDDISESQRHHKIDCAMTLQESMSSDTERDQFEEKKMGFQTFNDAIGSDNATSTLFEMDSTPVNGNSVLGQQDTESKYENMPISSKDLEYLIEIAPPTPRTKELLRKILN